jgi:hypothetical protein
MDLLYNTGLETFNLSSKYQEDSRFLKERGIEGAKQFAEMIKQQEEMK